MAYNFGSVSSGTMRPEDLIPDFVWELEHMKPCKRAHRTLIRKSNERIEADADEYFASEDADYDLNEGLFPALDEYAAPYHYFGAHPGDGCDYGWWLSESFEEDFDGLKVSDLAEVPTGYVGEVLLVNDHGNMTLYRKPRNHKLIEVWAVV